MLGAPPGDNGGMDQPTEVRSSLQGTVVDVRVGIGAAGDPRPPRATKKRPYVATW